jgi:hypothetical protein
VSPKDQFTMTLDMWRILAPRLKANRRDGRAVLVSLSVQGGEIAARIVYC